MQGHILAPWEFGHQLASKDVEEYVVKPFHKTHQHRDYFGHIHDY
jgi:hypothetical protein